MKGIELKRYSMVILFFIGFLLLLYYSYVYKLGYLKITTYLLFLLILLAISYNASRSNNSTSMIFWIFLFFIFLYAVTDKYYKIHGKLSENVPIIYNIPPTIMLNILYMVAFFIVMTFFHKFFIEEFKNRRSWLYLFAAAIIIKIIAILIDFQYHDITEDYLEVSSLYFFFAAFIYSGLQNKSKVISQLKLKEFVK